MGHAVRSTLLELGIGAFVQRFGQLIAMVWICRVLGEDRIGTYALGLAMGALLSVLAGAGVRALVAREIARAPDAAGAWLRAAVRARLFAGLVGTAIVSAFAIAVNSEPWFWILCALQTLPAAFDQKSLFDAVARTRTEVLLETASGLLFLGSAIAWAVAGGHDLTMLAAIHLACRMVYAAGAAHAIARLPREAALVRPRELRRRSRSLALGHLAYELVGTADIWVVALLADNAVVGLFAVALRVVGAAALPSAQLVRLFQPHLHRAAAAGDLERTARTALRATALVVLPVAAGGWVVADPLCGLFGPQFAPAGAALRWLLLALSLQHLGWQCSHALLARGRDRDYALGIWTAPVLHLVGMLVLVPWLGACGAGLSQALAQLGYLTVSCLQLRGTQLPSWRLLMAPLGLAGVTAGAALLATVVVDGGRYALAAPLAAGALAGGLGLWLVELRGRLRRLGDGLVQASGFRR